MKTGQNLQDCTGGQHCQAVQPGYYQGIKAVQRRLIYLLLTLCIGFPYTFYQAVRGRRVGLLSRLLEGEGPHKLLRLRALRSSGTPLLADLKATVSTPPSYRARQDC
jgi:hypothetical protein